MCSAWHCSGAAEGQHAHNTATCAFLACLWEPSGDQRRRMPGEVLSHPFFQPGLEQKGGAASSHCAVLFSETSLMRGVPGLWKANQHRQCLSQLLLSAVTCCLSGKGEQIIPCDVSSFLLVQRLLKGEKEPSYVLDSPYLSLGSSTAFQACLCPCKHFGN